MHHVRSESSGTDSKTRAAAHGTRGFGARASLASAPAVWSGVENGEANRSCASGQSVARNQSVPQRVFEMICAATGLAVLSPLFALIGLAVMFEDRGPVFYSSPRVGKDFRLFGLLKFRSMVVDAERLGGLLTTAGDRRVTRVGRFLRKYKLDELPQLVNVLKADLNFVGSRPESERYVAMFRSQYASILRHRPGITDPATLAYRDEESLLQGQDVEKLYITDILPRKIEASSAYLERRTFFSDLGVIGQTLLRIVWFRREPNVPKLAQPSSDQQSRSNS
jgi:lipopolysaccharide/colanic/teichoic acid biosynthesis glycosyltransferase